MSELRAKLATPDAVKVDVTITATLAEWKLLKAAIGALKTQQQVYDVTDEYGDLREPFWSLVVRLGAVVEAVEKQHANYE